MAAGRLLISKSMENDGKMRGVARRKPLRMEEWTGGSWTRALPAWTQDLRSCAHAGIALGQGTRHTLPRLREAYGCAAGRLGSWLRIALEVLTKACEKMAGLLKTSFRQDITSQSNFRAHISR